MPTDPATTARMLVRKDDFSQLRFDRPCPDAAGDLRPGQARLRIEHFALTANNITYAAFGESMRYWQFFPAAQGWGCIPVWGFATVVESRADGVVAGERIYGYLPMATHLVVQPIDAAGDGFSDGTAHRQGLPSIYNRYACTTLAEAHVEGLRAVLRPLFTTAFLIDDFVDEQGAFGAQIVVLSSASSKTAFATAFCLSRRSERAFRIVGLTAAANAGFARSLGCYDEIFDYSGWRRATGHDTPALYIDFSGDAALRRAIHEHFGDSLRYSCAVGGTHWQALGSAAGLPGPRPALFFAPSHAQRRGSPAPEGYGRAGLLLRIDSAWCAFMQAVTSAATPWLRIETHRGEAAVQAIYREVLIGRADPQAGHMLAL